MVKTKAQRTIVKSPPELWAELSDPAALARHLGALGGEITITRTEPEKTVVWEGERATGRVDLAPSGWGTKVTLTVTTSGPSEGATSDVTPSPPATEAAAAARPAEGEAAQAAIVPIDTAFDVPQTPPPVAASPEVTPELLQPAVEAPLQEDPADADAAVQAETLAAAEAPLAPKRGFFARLFGRRRDATPVVDAPAASETSIAAEASDEPAMVTPGQLEAPAVVAERVAADPTSALADPTPVLADPTPVLADPTPVLADPTPVLTDPTPVLAESETPEASVASEGQAAAPVATPETPAIDAARANDLLMGVLDTLGAAHHRPFSRS
jgi:hypothetical protein